MSHGRLTMMRGLLVFNPQKQTGNAAKHWGNACVKRRLAKMNPSRQGREFHIAVIEQLRYFYEAETFAIGMEVRTH